MKFLWIFDGTQCSDSTYTPHLLSIALSSVWMIFWAALLIMWIPPHKWSPTFLVHEPLVLRISSLKLEGLLIEECCHRLWLPWLVLVPSLEVLMLWITTSGAVDTKSTNVSNICSVTVCHGMHILFYLDDYVKVNISFVTTELVVVSFSHPNALMSTGLRIRRVI